MAIIYVQNFTYNGKKINVINSKKVKQIHYNKNTYVIIENDPEYQKKKTLLGKWQINIAELIQKPGVLSATQVAFTSNGQKFTKMQCIDKGGFLGEQHLKYNTTQVAIFALFKGKWTNAAYKTIEITNVDKTKNIDELLNWLQKSWKKI